ncbi:hypothetical protein BT96DRAFT_914946 [Gymnopus androsaceus JB14]|uniref:G-protein coupled receptors family 3 profile domain-containing protein n=1 Tax=Gymnopus androsaceus JB14 TaxID=1447944 RepID=A0A6A4IE31_9AGAR|nr:hypothetical protein BT96DRAFT_914946 [Gymnopus androsaceus JB14]
MDLDILSTRIFIALQSSGGIGMVILVAARIRRFNISCNPSSNGPDGTINRTRTWTSFCISWIISCFSYCLLLLAGKQFDVDEQPAYGLCLAQATLIYSSPPLTACTTLSLFFDLWWRFRGAEIGLMSTGGTAIYVAGGVNPQTVERDLASAPYCIMKDSVIPVFVSALVFIITLAVMIVLVILARSIYRMRMQVNWGSSNDKAQMPSFIIRLLLFGLLALVAVTVSIIFVFNRTPGVQTNLALAALPPAGVLVFGTQKDFLHLWFSLLRWSIQSLPCSICRRVQSQELQSRRIRVRTIGGWRAIKDGRDHDIEMERIDTSALHDSANVLVSPCTRV